jgi:hypothetical protein
MVYAEIHQQMPFFDNRKDIFKIVVLKIQLVSMCIGASSTHRLLNSWKTSQSQFLVVFQSSPIKLSLDKFWQFWVILGNFWADLGRIYDIANG